MSLLDVVRAGVAIANQVTAPLQPTVTFEKATLSTDGFSTKTYPTSVPLRAIIDWKQRQVRTATGVLTVSRAAVSFLDIVALATATNGLGIQDDDRITLPDGTTGPILDMGGFIDAGTGIPIATEVFLG